MGKLITFLSVFNVIVLTISLTTMLITKEPFSFAQQVTHCSIAIVFFLVMALSPKGDFK